MANSSPLTPAMKMLHHVALSEQTRDMSIDELRQLLERNPDLFDEAAHDIFSLFAGDPAVCFLFLDICKSIIPRQLSTRRGLAELKPDQLLGVVQMLDGEPLIDFFGNSPNTTLLSFYMMSGGQVWVAVATNAKQPSSRTVRFIVAQVVPDEGKIIFPASGLLLSGIN